VSLGDSALPALCFSVRFWMTPPPPSHGQEIAQKSDTNNSGNLADVCYSLPFCWYSSGYLYPFSWASTVRIAPKAQGVCILLGLGLHLK
jgi:hypothetical protein